MCSRFTTLLLFLQLLFTSFLCAEHSYAPDQPDRTPEGWFGYTGRYEYKDYYGKPREHYRALREVCRAHYCPLHFRDRPNVVSIYKRKVHICPSGDLELALPYLDLIPRTYFADCGYCPDCEHIVAMEYEYDNNEDEEDALCCYPVDDCAFMGCRCGRDAEYEFDSCGFTRGAWYYGYFLEDYHQYFSFFLDHLEFCSENPECRLLWPEFPSESSTINDMAYRTFSTFISEKLLDDQYYFSWPHLDNHEQATTLVCYPVFYSHYDQLCQDICNYIDQTCLYPERSSEAITDVRAFLDSTHPLYLTLYGRCIENYPHPRLYWERGLVHYHRGEAEEFLRDVRSLMDATNGTSPLLDSPAYAKQGEMYLLACSYAEAVNALTTAIAKDKSNKDAYFLRAQAYFELGQFDAAIGDFLESGFHSTPVSGENYFQFASGLLVGSLQGGAESFCDLIPSLLSTIHGLANNLWAFALDPCQVSKEVVETATALFSYLYTHKTNEILAAMAPEIAELIRNWDSLTSYQKGEGAGFVIGKYGVDILAFEGVAAGAKYYKALKNASALATLETVAKGGASSKKVMAQATRCAERRAGLCQPGKIRIEDAKQGKHIPGYHNFDPEKSIWTHPDPQGLLDRFAGTGRRVRGEAFGEAGYKEIVDFGEEVGKVCISEDKKIWATTTWGQIHYSKSGAHIVPHIVGGN